MFGGVRVEIYRHKRQGGLIIWHPPADAPHLMSASLAMHERGFVYLPRRMSLDWRSMVVKRELATLRRGWVLFWYLLMP